ncbi:SOS response-associated peptidase [Geothrix sp. PMB-07]|uniref:SOS response-associated peptidase n=1 Tax=Geothrix sp. PMB-07 TaxID=3068640 RepID=UPI002741A120|nr:SOS response-associated peptidase [Geothrix sp. PMB-07]WLT32753.1 SOS response-associated peptidase [Geothrix sp. PMB-07]
MCTQAAFLAMRGKIKERLLQQGAGPTTPTLPPNPRIRPTDQMPIVRLHGCEWLTEARSWKLIPHWVKPEDFPKWKAYSTWNARDDEVATKPSWRGPFKAKRCLLVLEGFYEKKVLFTNSDPNEMIVIAGLFDDWGLEGSEIRSCTMITTEPNDLIAPFHHRMPAILGPESWDLWLAHSTTKESLQRLLRPCPPEWLNQIA